MTIDDKASRRSRPAVGSRDTVQRPEVRSGRERGLIVIGLGDDYDCVVVSVVVWPDAYYKSVQHGK